MALFTEWDTTAPYEQARRWKEESLRKGTSLLWPSDIIWTEANLRAFHVCFVDRPDMSTDSFEKKLERQLHNQSKEVIQLACELVFLYFLFPSNVSGRRKKELVQQIAAWGQIDLADDHAVLRALEKGIGSGGLAYNARRPYEINYLARIALHLLTLTETERDRILFDHVSFRETIDPLQDEGSMQGRHILLHLLYPEQYERIASIGHKQLIAEAFADVLDDREQAMEDIDDRIYVIRTKLESLLAEPGLDFYRDSLKDCWYGTDKDQELDPISGLQIKRQIVFYGPPGTGKTYEAKALAERMVRQGALRKWRAGKYFQNQIEVEKAVRERIRRVQFHPGYGYEEFVRGLQLEQGRTVYKNGVLLQILDFMEAADDDFKDLPFVVILDEMNRADLSKVLGECFSLMEDRGTPIELAGQDGTTRKLSLPANLYFIGTMNLVDQSLEQVDFALRRRFLWFFSGFDRLALLSLLQFKWENGSTNHKRMKSWAMVEEEFEAFGDRCLALNKIIANNEILGTQYEIGHTYFSDVIDFAQKALSVQPGMQQILFNKKGQGRGPVA